MTQIAFNRFPVYLINYCMLFAVELSGLYIHEMQNNLTIIYKSNSSFYETHPNFVHYHRHKSFTALICSP